MNHYFTLRTYYEDTDVGGIVYHANYLKYAERARTEFLHQLGMTNAELLDQDIMIVVSRIEIDYVRPAFLEDTLRVRTSVEKLGAATAVLCQRITKGRDLVVLLKVHLAFISKASMHPIRINEALREKLKVYKK